MTIALVIIVLPVVQGLWILSSAASKGGFFFEGRMRTDSLPSKKNPPFEGELAGCIGGKLPGALSASLEAVFLGKRSNPTLGVFDLISGRYSVRPPAADSTR